MQKLNQHGEVEQIRWQWVKTSEELNDLNPSTAHLLPFENFAVGQDSACNEQTLGFWLNSDADINTAIPAARYATVIGINFPVFADGRGFSLARALREIGGFSGELIALGHYMQDQLFYLKRCGFDSFILRENDNINSMKSSLKDFSETYQAATDQQLPLFRRRI